MEGVITIERLSSAVSKLCYISIALMPLILVWIWMDPERVAQDFSDTSDLVLPEAIGFLTRFFGFTLSIIPTILMIKGLLSLKEFLNNLQKSDYFNPNNPTLLRKFAYMLLWSTLARPLIGALVSIVITINNPPGQRTVAFSLGTDEISGVFVALLIMLLSLLMAESKSSVDERARLTT